jgi:hypothetical protein
VIHIISPQFHHPINSKDQFPFSHERGGVLNPRWESNRPKSVAMKLWWWCNDNYTDECRCNGKSQQECRASGKNVDDAYWRLTFPTYSLNWTKTRKPEVKVLTQCHYYLSTEDLVFRLATDLHRIEAFQVVQMVQMKEKLYGTFEGFKTRTLQLTRYGS